MHFQEKKKVLEILDEVNFYSVYADFSQLKANFNYVISLFRKLLRFNEIDEYVLEMLNNFVEIEKIKPPHAMPDNPPDDMSTIPNV